MQPASAVGDWRSAWPDAVAFAVGLAAAWWSGWTAGDLVWSLWLSSLVVGYSVIVWMVAAPAFAVGRSIRGWQDPLGIRNSAALAWAVLVAGTMLVLGFLTLHFGMFHYIHSQLLIGFFPIDGNSAGLDSAVSSTFNEIVRRYWTFLPAAFLAERAAFTRKPLAVDGRPSLASIVSSVAGKPARPRELVSGPYRNVMRIHVLIFFFFLAHFAKLDNFVVYAVVYAAYFFPWRLLRSAGPKAATV